MRQISKLLFILTTIILFSCSSGRQVVYRDCDCDRTTLSFGWGFNDPYWSWGNPWRWNDPYWSWRSPYLGWNNWYWSNPPIIRPTPPSRYEGRQTIGSRPSRNGGMEGSQDNLYHSNPNRVQNRTRPEYQYYEPSQRKETPSRSRVRIQTRENNPNNNSINRSETPSRSRVETSRPTRTQSPQISTSPQPQQRTYTPRTNTNTEGTTPSRGGNQNNQEK